MVRGIDSRLLNVSVLDGGLGITVQGRPPMRTAMTITVPPTNDDMLRKVNNTLLGASIKRSRHFNVREYTSYVSTRLNDQIRF